MNKPIATSQRLLRIALFGNAGFSVLSAVIIAGRQDRLMHWMGAPADFNALFLAFGLVAFAVWLIVNAIRTKIKLSDARLAVGMDLAWVVLSASVVVFAPLNWQGRWVVGVVAAIVLCFAVTQWIGIRKIIGDGKEL